MRLFPHQRKVAERLAGQYARSWLVADEVGPDKTVSAGLAPRRLLLAGDVERALVLAPANVCRQWQDELFEKFGLWVPRYKGGGLLGAYPDDVRQVPSGVNCWFWCSAFSGSYDNAANTTTENDVPALRSWFEGGSPPEVVSGFSFDPERWREITGRQRALRLDHGPAHGRRSPGLP